MPIGFTGGHKEIVIHYKAATHDRQRAYGELPDVSVHGQDVEGHLQPVETAEEVPL